MEGDAEVIVPVKVIVDARGRELFSGVDPYGNPCKHRHRLAELALECSLDALSGRSSSPRSSVVLNVLPGGLA